jgi:hypothetical protein
MIPAGGDTLNYRLTAFSVPTHDKATGYRLEIAQGINNNEVFFNKNIITKTLSKDSRIIETLPAFNQAYTWRIIYLSKNSKELSKTKFSHFTTGWSKYLDTTKFRVNVLDTATGYDSLYMFMDCTRTINDIHGHTIWYLPNIPGIVDENSTVRDLKITPFSTITFLADSRAVEIDYNGNLLWKAPNDGKISGDTAEYYHHEFTRLGNGNYMVAGHRFEFRKIPSTEDTAINKGGQIEKRPDGYYKKILFGTLIEYSIDKNIVWSWRSGDYFSDDDVFVKKTARGFVNSSTHMNGFYFDEKTQAIYTTYRDVNRIVKISYPSGRLLTAYGENFSPTHHMEGNGWFYGLHHSTILSDGSLCIFNNNNRADIPSEQSEKMISEVLILKEPASPAEKLVKTFSFPCNIDTMANYHSAAGASVYELQSGALLTCMGSANRAFIVDRNKNVLWNSLYEMRPDNKWTPYSCYRISPLYISQLQQLLLKSN